MFGSFGISSYLCYTLNEKQIINLNFIIMKVLGKDGDLKVRNKQKVDEAGYTHAVCVKTGQVLPLDKFRVHKTGYYLGYSKEYEAQKAKERRKAKEEAEKTIEITTASGASYKASLQPIVGGRKASHDDTETVLYFAPGVTRDQVRSAFRAHTGVPATGIKAPIVE
jgi:hypothetical protein